MMRGVHPALAILVLLAWAFGGLQVPGAEAARADVSEVPCILANEDKQKAEEVSKNATDKREKAEAALEDAKKKIGPLETDLKENLARGKANGASAYADYYPMSTDPDSDPVPDPVKKFISAWKNLPPYPVPPAYWDGYRGVPPLVMDSSIAGYLVTRGGQGYQLPFNFVGNENREKELQAGKAAVAKAESDLETAKAEEKAAKEWLVAATKHYEDCQGEDPPPPRKRNTRKAGELDYCESEYWLCP